VVETVLAACQRHDVVAGIHCGSVETAQRWRDRGFRMLNVTSDAIFLRARATAVVRAFAGQPEPAQPRSSSYA
jgi:2-keto-3-deoxy-L-rhamnonate aldolase RhmA